MVTTQISNQVEFGTTNSIESIRSFSSSEAFTNEDHDVSGKNHYRDLCQQSNVIPCTYFMAHIQDKELVLRYHQFSHEDVRVIARTLSVMKISFLIEFSFRFQFCSKSNLFVEKLLLDGNFLQQQAAKYIAQMIVTNDFITELVKEKKRRRKQQNETKRIFSRWPKIV